MIYKDLYMDVTNVSDIESVNITGGYGQTSAVATVVCNTTTLGLNDLVTINGGYYDNHTQLFYGRVKSITRSRETGNITVVAKDILIDAADFFIVADNPEEPFKRQNKLAQDLIHDLLELANITNYTSNVPLSFTYGVSVAAEFNLISVLDACNQIASILAWHLYADVATVKFEDIRPYYRTGAKKNTDYGLSNQVDDVISHRFCTDGTISGSNVNPYVKTINLLTSDEGLRNKVVVYGRDNLVEKAQTSSPYLPANFYKAAVIASPLIDSSEMAQAAADYNLDLYNRLTQSCTLDIMGDPTIKPRQFCEIVDDFSGLEPDSYFFIQNVSHTFGANGFETKLTCSR